MPDERLSYQRLLDITQKLPGHEQAYIFRFLSSNEQKAKRAAELAEQESRACRADREAMRRATKKLEKDASALPAYVQKVNELTKRNDNRNIVKKLCERIKSFEDAIARATRPISPFVTQCQRVNLENLADELRETLRKTEARITES